MDPGDLMPATIPDHDDVLSVQADAAELAYRLWDDHDGDVLRCLRDVERERPTDDYDRRVLAATFAVLWGWCRDAERRVWHARQDAWAGVVASAIRRKHERATVEQARAWDLYIQTARVA